MKKGEKAPKPKAYKVDAALEHRVVLLAGPETELRNRSLSELVKKATDGDEAEAETIIADTVSPREWVGAASVAPFLSPRRTVVVRNVARVGLDDDEDGTVSVAETWVTAARALPETAMLILVADDETGDETRQTRLLARARDWRKHVEAVGGCVGWFEVDPKGLPEAIREYANEAGLKLTTPAVDALAEMVGGNYGQAMGEIEKLRLYVDEGAEIREEDVRRVVTPDPAYNVYRLVDFILQGQTGHAVRQLRTLYGRHAKIEAQAFSRVLPTLRGQLSRVWQAKVCIDARCGFHNLPPEVAALLPRQNISSLADWQLRPLTRIASRVSFPQLAQAMEAAVDADAKIKGQRPSHSPHETLEEMVLRLCQIFSPAPAGR